MENGEWRINWELKVYSEWEKIRDHHPLQYKKQIKPFSFLPSALLQSKI